MSPPFSGPSGVRCCLNSYLMSCLVSSWYCRLRRIDAFASVLWFVVMSLHLVERYLETETPSWLDTAKFGTTSLCCLVGFTAAVATRKSTGHRRYRPRRSEPEQWRWGKEKKKALWTLCNWCFSFFFLFSLPLFLFFLFSKLGKQWRSFLPLYVFLIFTPVLASHCASCLEHFHCWC